MPHEMGFDYMGMSYQEQKRGRVCQPGHFRTFTSLRVFDSCGALRKLDVALQRPAEHSCRRIRRPRSPVAASLCNRPLHAAYMVQMENDVYTQIGLVMLIGLGAKNSILIVAFAKEDYERGMSLVDAALSAARLRFRPLMMTALAFIVGCVPLWIASGAGSVARQIIGTTVIGGMLAETFIGRFFVPAIFYVVEKFSGAEKRKALPLAPAEAPSLGD